MKVAATSKLAVAAGFVALALGVIPAEASLVYSLNTPNAGLSSATGPYGNVTVTRTSNTTATLSFDALSGFVFAGAQAIAANINATSFTASGASFTVAFPPPTTQAIIGSGPMQADGFGNFNQAYDLFDGYTSSVTHFQFNVTSTSGPAWLADANVLTGNNLGNVLAAHVFACNSNPCIETGPGSGASATGWATTSGFPSSSTVAEPNSSSLALLALGLLGAGFWTRRKV